MPSKEGRIAIRPYTCVIRTLANIHINHVNTQKKTSWAWYEGVCVRRRGELKFAHITICPYCKIHLCCKFVHIVNSSILQNSSMLQIHLCFQLPLMGGRIAIRPYMCVIRTLANIHINHVNTQKKDVMGMV